MFYQPLEWLAADHMYIPQYLYRGFTFLKRIISAPEPESIAGDLATRCGHTER